MKNFLKTAATAAVKILANVAKNDGTKKYYRDFLIFFECRRSKVAQLQHEECYNDIDSENSDKKFSIKVPIFFCVDFDILLTSQRKEQTIYSID
ncbi:MAG: hypothetical protein K2I89_10805, partial [Muribaculaceae bacterium]|nr:hypothetical protein [Muribaculaceae bacterium]